MDEVFLRERIEELLAQTRPVPAAPAETDGQGAATPATMAESPLKRRMADLEDGLDHLRVAIKYLVFDLEATKRENRLLREMLD